MKIAIISDTHSLLRPEIEEILHGCDYILHAGDISSQEIYDRISKIAPSYFVRGNADKEWAEPRKLRPKEVYTAGNLYADDNRIRRHISDRKTEPFSNSEERLEVPASERNGQTHKEYCKGYGCRQNGRDNL